MTLVLIYESKFMLFPKDERIVEKMSSMVKDPFKNYEE